MQPYSAITIIYNPKSTGPSEANARSLEQKLKNDPGISAPVSVIATSHASHAEALAYQLAVKTKRPLIISSSGDGGYSEVVNGVMRAQYEGSQPITGLLPSGNANDHYHSLSSGELETLIAEQRERTIDLIKVTIRHGKTSWHRYAHSYTGIGLTADASIQYNKINMNRINELLVSVKAIYSSQRSEVIIKGATHTYDSLVFSNVNRLGKLFSLSETSRVDDGKFEVIALQSKTKVELLQQLAKALAAPYENLTHASQFTFTTTKSQAIQFDGEVFQLETGTTVTVECAHKALHCIV